MIINDNDKLLKHIRTNSRSELHELTQIIRASNGEFGWECSYKETDDAVRWYLENICQVCGANLQEYINCHTQEKIKYCLCGDNK